MKFSVIGVAISVATLVAVVAFIIAGYGAAAGISLVSGISLTAFHFCQEPKYVEEKEKELENI